MKQRCPDSLFISLARLPDWKWIINGTGYANIIPSPGDEVYGSLCFLSGRDETALDESEGVPWLYEKHPMKVNRVSTGGEWGNEDEQVEATVYVDVQLKDTGHIEREYIVWVKKAIEDGIKCGMPESYADRYLRPWLPRLAPGEEPLDVVMVRTTKFGLNAQLVPKGFASWSRG